MDSPGENDDLAPVRFDYQYIIDGSSLRIAATQADGDGMIGLSGIAAWPTGHADTSCDRARRCAASDS